MLVFAVEPKFRKNGLVYPKTARAISGSTVENLAQPITFQTRPTLFSYLSQKSNGAAEPLKKLTKNEVIGVNLSDSGRCDVMARHARQLNTHKNNFNPNYLGCLWLDSDKLNGIESDFYCRLPIHQLLKCHPTFSGHKRGLKGHDF